MGIAFTGLTNRRRVIGSNPNKLVLDPYARAHAGALIWDPAVFGYQMESADDLTFDERDSAAFMPKCVVVDPDFDGQGEPGNHTGFLTACMQDPVLTTVQLIAEPWDCGPGGYQVGGFPPGWAEWNDKFRDTVRDFWRGEAPIAARAPRLCASAEQFNRGGRRAWACVNFITAHDGFTLNDSVTYNDKHNEANGEDGKHGSSDNRSWNHGVEGPTEDAAINELRERQIRNMLATLILSQGAPMLLAGDEFGRTQTGNNNAYCQDNEISRLDWDIKPKGQSLTGFTQKLTSLRHRYPILRHARFLNAEYNEELGSRTSPGSTPMAQRCRRTTGLMPQ
jgi:glycogen debranching enzyme GlgX